MDTVLAPPLRRSSSLPRIAASRLVAVHAEAHSRRHSSKNRPPLRWPADEAPQAGPSTHLRPQPWGALAMPPLPVPPPLHPMDAYDAGRVKEPAAVADWVQDMHDMEHEAYRRDIALQSLLDYGITSVKHARHAVKQSHLIAVPPSVSRISSIVAVVMRPGFRGQVGAMPAASIKLALDILQHLLDHLALYWFSLRIPYKEPFVSQVRQRLIQLLLDIALGGNDYPPSLLMLPIPVVEQGVKYSGGFADVYKAQLRGQPVALKQLRYAGKGTRATVERRLCREALLWRQLRHPNVLPLMGIIDNLFGMPAISLVSPWVPHGNVIEYLSTMTRRDTAISLRFIREIASGIHYLHQQNMVHGDIRGANILVDDKFVVRLADFGLANLDDEMGGSATNQAGALAWMAPELHFPEDFGLPFARTQETDVYAFGCTCREVFTLRRPFDGLRPQQIWLAVLRRERPPWPSTDECGGAQNRLPDWLWQLVSQCCADAPDGRPSMGEIVQATGSVAVGN